MLLDVTKIAKKVFKDKELIVKELPEGKVKISYKNIGYRTSNHMFSPVLPKYVDLDEQFSEAIGSYIGDGMNSKNSMWVIQYTSKDSDICQFILKFFTERFGIQLEDIKFNICYKFGDEEELKEKWSKFLCVHSSRFRTYRMEKNFVKDNLTIMISGTIFRRIFQYIVENYFNEIGKNRILRRGFLRGYFAAEGSISYYKAKNRRQLMSSISYSYHAGKEDWIRDFCIECLRKENIKAHYKNYRKNDGKIIITNWSNYQKLWCIKVFDRCQRKKDLFIQLAKKLKVYIKLKTDFRNGLFSKMNGTTQENIAMLINSTQGNVSEMIRGNRPIELNQLKILCKYANIDFRSYMENIELIKIYHRTSIQVSENFLNILV